MNSAECEELIAYKIGRANETIDEVEVLIKYNLLYTVVNRLYYACFYAVSALLIKKEISARKHSGIKQMFGLHFISTGLIILNQVHSIQTSLIKDRKVITKILSASKRKQLLP